MDQKHRVILVEDHAIIREGVRAPLSEFKEFAPYQKQGWIILDQKES